MHATQLSQRLSLCLGLISNQDFGVARRLKVWGYTNKDCLRSLITFHLNHDTHIIIVETRYIASLHGLYLYQTFYEMVLHINYFCSKA